MSTPTPRHRHARKAEVAARVAVVLGLAAAIGLLATGGDPAAEFTAASAPCNGAAAPSAAL